MLYQGYALPNGSQEERNRRGKYGEEHVRGRGVCTGFP